MKKFNPERLSISQDHYLDNSPDDCATLKELRLWIECQIMKFGEDSYITLDAGYNNISAIVTTCRQETDEEYAKRLAQHEENSAKSKVAAKERKEKEAEAEKKLYEKLREKYERQN